MEVDHVGFRELTKPAVLKITPSGMLHLFYPPRKPETPPSPRTVSEVLLVSCCHDGCGKFPEAGPRYSQFRGIPNQTVKWFAEACVREHLTVSGWPYS